MAAASLAGTREATAAIIGTEGFEAGTNAWTLTGGWGTTSSGPHSRVGQPVRSPGAGLLLLAVGLALRARRREREL